MERACAVCGQEVPAASLVMSERGEVCATCSDAEEQSARGAALNPLVIGGLVAAAVPFFASFTTSRSVSVNGEVVQAVSRDYVAIGAGGVAVVLAVVLLKSIIGGSLKGTLNAAGAALVAAGGAYHLLRGLGVI